MLQLKHRTGGCLSGWSCPLGATVVHALLRLNEPRP